MGLAFGQPGGLPAGQVKEIQPAVDREDRAGVAVLAQEALRAGGVLGSVARGADQRHRARREQGLCE